MLPLEDINQFLQDFESHEVDEVTKTLIVIFDTAITKKVLSSLDSLEEKQTFLRLLQDDYSSPEILDFLIDTFPGSEALITETLERTLLAAKASIR